MISNLRIEIEKKQPCTWRQWRCPVHFTLAGKEFETEWSWVGEKPGDPDEIEARINGSILLALENGNFQLSPLSPCVHALT